MKRRILPGLFLFIALCVVSAAAQKNEAKPDFTGTWIWRIGDSDKYFHQIVIEQKENEIRIVEKINFPNQSLVETDMNHFTDGRGETNQLTNGQLVESVTNRKGNKLVFTYYETDTAKGKKKKLGTTEFSLKKDKLIFKKTPTDGEQETENFMLFQNEREFIRIK